MIRAVIFDLDNTLIDFMSIKRSSIDAAVTAMIASGLKMGKEEATKYMFQLYDEHGIEYQEIFQEFLAKVQKRIDYRILAAGIVAYRRLQLGLLEPYPNVIPTLLKLRERGYKLAILSDAPRLKAWIRLSEIRIADFFEVIVTFDDTGKMKPSIIPFRRVLRELNVSGNECVMVGDNPVRDIRGARRAGMKTVFARYGDTRKTDRSNADFEIESIEGLLEVVDKLNA
ncbi:TIGR02253 family HAD-type hydrolase [Candidatus Woesearchaeota archaeon]|nr:TIGR02253 family HAD-type hydrolase [Candidatus Woesearchaeota archaeon]